MGSPGSAPPRHPLVGQTLVFSGRLLSLGRPDARALVERLGAHVADDLSTQTTMLVVGGAPHGESQKLKRAEQMNAESPGRIRIMSEDEFCDLVGMTSPSALRQQYHAQRDLLERYPHVREDHLRYMQKWGLIRPVHRMHAETYYGFPDLGVIKQAEAELAEGASFRAVLKNLLSARSGQLAFDFRLDARAAKVLELKRREPPPLAALMSPIVQQEPSSAEQYFFDASNIDTGDPENVDRASSGYRRAL